MIFWRRTRRKGMSLPAVSFCLMRASDALPRRFIPIRTRSRSAKDVADT